MKKMVSPPIGKKSALGLSTVSRKARPLAIFVNDVLVKSGTSLREMCKRQNLPYPSFNQVLNPRGECSYPRKETLESMAAALSIELGVVIHPDDLYQLNSPWLEEIDLGVLSDELIKELGYE